MKPFTALRLASPSSRSLRHRCCGLRAAAASRRRSAPREPITLNFINAEIEAVARTMAAITGRNVVVDPRVKGTINLTTDRPVPPAAAFNQFARRRCACPGFTVVEADGLYKVVPEADAKLQSSTVHRSAPPASAATRSSRRSSG